MAWTTPRTWVAGENPTATIFNTHVRDNLIDLDSRVSALGAGTVTVNPMLLMGG